MQNKIKFSRHFVVILLSMMIMNFCVFDVFAESASIVVEAEESVNVGRSFDVNFNLDGNIEIYAFMFEIEYNQDYISFRDAIISEQNGGEVEFYTEGGVTTVICLFSDSIQSGNFLTLQFTAKTGNNPSSQTISFKCNQAVDADINDASVNMTENINIEIVKASSNSSTSSSIKSGSTNKTTSSNSKSSATSKNESSSKDKNSSINASNRIYADTEESYIFVESEEGVLNSNSELGINYLDKSDSNIKYVMAGAGLTASLFLFLYIAYRMGQASMGKRFDNDENEEEEDSSQEDDKSTDKKADSEKTEEKENKL